MRKSLRIAAWTGVSIGVLVVLLGWTIRPLVNFAMRPGDTFAAQAEPSEPHYSDPLAWSALPESDDLADRAPEGYPIPDQRRASVDVFYLHPTTYVGSHWNGPADDQELNANTDRLATGIQAAAFNGCCAVYAPRYRQANGTAFIRHSADGQRAIDLAFADVRRAFEAFNSRRGAERPFVLAAHSQGTVLAERLLYEVISGTPFREKLVAAYLIGGRLTTAGLARSAPDIGVCQSADELHCVVAWNARSESYRPTGYEMIREDSTERVCTNPLSWRTDDAYASAKLNRGAVFLESENGLPRPGFADARCVDGELVVAHFGRVPRDIPSRVLDHVMGSGNYHPIEYQLFFLNIRENAIARSAAFAARSTGR